MKFSEQWLREWVDPDLSTDELLEQLTMAGLEVDGYEPVAGNTTQVIVGEIEAVNKHPDADKLVVCTVNHGAGTHQVVCGAPNARAGIKVPFALVGAQLDDFKIKKAKLRGVESFGMLCSEREIGISDDHEGLMELAADAPTGADIREYLKLDDVIVDLDLTPNRSDCLGIVGLARETALINELDWSPIDPPSVTPVIEDTFPVTLDMGSGCPRFVGRVVKGSIPVSSRHCGCVRNSAAAGFGALILWSTSRITSCSRWVNPCMLMIWRSLSGRIVVRTAGDNEEMTLLDEQKVKLNRVRC